MEEIANLLRNLPEDDTCKKAPVESEENVTFLIDTKALRNPNDWKADDLGAFHNVGKVTVGYFHVTASGARFLSKKKPSRVKDETVVLLKKTYWTHQRYKDFKRRCFEGYDYKGVRLPHVLLCYELMMSLTLSPQQLMEMQRRVTVRTIGVVQVHCRASKRKQKNERGLLKYATKFLRTLEVCLDSSRTGFCQGTDNRSVMLNETRSRKKTKMKCAS